VTGDDRASDDRARGDWARYWRAGDQARGAMGPIEAMHAHFRSHVYHRHSHETYSFGVTDDGAQAFTCRGGHHVSTANMVMLFNPDDPHDGHAATGPGFTYRMIHLAPALVEELLGESAIAGVSGRGSASGRAGVSGRPLFPTPVIDDPWLAQRLRLLYNVLTGTSTPLEQHQHLTSTMGLLTRHATPATAVLPAAPVSPVANGLTAPASARIASRVRALLHDAYATPLAASDLAAVAGCSRYTATRAFTAAYGLTPSDYQRQLRLRAARTLLTDGTSPAEAAATVGFADQAHLTRWFRRYYGVTPGVYRQAVGMR
jgi:AraC-like DNA-binding protein